MENIEEYMIPCLNKKFLGVECFGCGLQRSVILVFKGEFIEAFYMYPAVFTVIPLFILIIINLFFKFKHSGKIINTLAIVSILIIIVSFIIKNFFK